LPTLLWRALAVLSLSAGLLGVLLPALPTVPFVLVAAWAASRGWPALERWLLGHPRLGPPLQRWRDGGKVPRAAKWAASRMMLASALTLALLPLPMWLKVGVPAIMALTALWLWRRPE
jgi:uncharacterized membrane protein YbaN (DUF454 family)